MEQTENRMGTEAVPILLIKTTVPLMVSLLASSLYNIIDSIFVSHINESALTAISMASPVQVLIPAMGCGIAVGLNSAISRAMGEKNQDKVRDVASAAIFMAFCAYLVLVCLCLFFVRPYFYWQT